MITQLGCASIFWQTIGGTIIGNLGAEVIKDKLDKEDDEKDESSEPCAMPCAE